MCMQYPQGLEDDIVSPDAEIKRWLWATCGYWELNLGPVGEQPVSLTAEPSLRSSVHLSISLWTVLEFHLWSFLRLIPLYAQTTFSFAQLSAGEHLGRVCLWTFTDSTSADVSGHPSPSFSSEYEPRTGIGGSDSTSQLLEELPNSLPQLLLSHNPIHRVWVSSHSLRLPCADTFYFFWHSRHSGRCKTILRLEFATL